MTNAIDKVKVTRQRDNWKARALALEKELAAYKKWLDELASDNLRLWDSKI